MGASTKADRGRVYRFGGDMTYLYVRTGTELHVLLCDAFLQCYGFVLVDDSWHEILTVQVDPEWCGQVWAARRVSAGSA